MPDIDPGAKGPEPRSMSRTGRFVTYTLHDIARTLTPLGKPGEIPITPDTDDIFVSHLEEDGFWPAIEKGEMLETDVIGDELQTDLGTETQHVSLNLIVLNERTAQYEGANIPLGLLDFGTEPRPCGSGSYAYIFFFENGLTQISIERVTEETEGMTIYDEIENLIRIIGKNESSTDYKDRHSRSIEGMGHVEDFVQAWPQLFELATSLP